MGKLLGQILKEDIKAILPWMVLPPIAVFVWLSILLKVGENPIIGFLAGLSMFLLLIAPFIALISAAVNDWNRFYGKNAAFYSGLPFTSGQVLGARFINYLIMGIIAGIAAFINISMLAASQGSGMELFDVIGMFIREIQETFGNQMLVMVGLYILIAGISVASLLVFANTLGSVKELSGLSYFAPIIIFFVVNILTTSIFSRIQANEVSAFISVNANVSPEMIRSTLAANPPTRLIWIPTLANTAISIVLNSISYYIHKNKLSVA